MKTKSARSKTSIYIHPTAVVSKEAELGPGVEIAAYAVIGPQVKIGSGTRVGSHAVIEGQTQIGERCEIFVGACIGMPAQARNLERVNSSVILGDENVLREYVTVNASMKEGGRTVLGRRNLLMIGSHVAHDCVLGDDITLANSVALAGHVTVEDRVMIGGLVGVHQFVRIGKLAMVGGLSKVVMDLAPFSMNDGHPARFCGLNAVGLRRAGIKTESMTRIKAALKILLGDGHNLERAVPLVEKRFGGDPQVRYLLSFIGNSKRGVARATAPKTEED